MSAQRPKAQVARLLQAPGKTPMSRQQLILALRRMSMSLPPDPAIDPAFYEFAERFRKSVGPRLLEMAAELEAQGLRNEGRDD